MSKFERIDVRALVTNEKPTTPKIIINEVNNFSTIVTGKMSPYPTVVIVVMHQYKLITYVSQSDLSLYFSIHVPLKVGSSPE
jgi:hypothetical protein